MKTLAHKTHTYQEMTNFLRALMKEYGIKAISVAVNNVRETFLINLGFVDSLSQKPVDSYTVFRAASLSQPVFAYLVMKLADEGLIELDAPLYKYLKRPLPDYPDYKDLKGDPRYKKLTARLILSHQSGLPDSRETNPSGQLEFKSSPGKQFGYSREGYRLLQFVLEEFTGRPINDLAKEKVFDHLSMPNTSFLWERRFDGNFAVSPDAALDPRIQKTRERADVTDSLITNASDFMNFISVVNWRMGMMDALSWVEFSRPEVSINSKSIFGLSREEDKKSLPKKLSWGLGWGYYLSPRGDVYFLGERANGYENYAAAYSMSGIAIIIFSVTTNERTFTGQILEELIGDTSAPLDWLDFGLRYRLSS
jgi:CubicO group peptidase (beta-lactamase class C family)